MSTQPQSVLEFTHRPLAHLLRLAWPITISMLSFSTMTLCDTLLVAHLGTSALAGVGLGGVTLFLFLCFPFGVLRANKNLVAHAIGAGRRSDVGGYRSAAVASGLAMGLVALVCGEVAALFVGVLADDAASAHAAAVYLRARMLGAPFAVVFVALREVAYGEGQVRAPMVASAAANVANIALAAGAIWGLEWGVGGVGLAAALAHGLELGFLVLLIGRPTLAGVSWRRHRTELWRVGVPIGVQSVLEIGAFQLLTILISRMGVLEIAAHQVALRIFHFVFLPSFGVAEAAAVMAGLATGAKADAWVKRIARLAVVLVSGYTMVWMLLLAFAAPLVVRGFTADPKLARVAIHVLYAAAGFMVLNGINIVARSVLRGVGDVRYPALVGILTSWLATPPLAWALGYGWGWGAVGGWLGLTLEVVVGSGLLWWRIESGRWRDPVREPSLSGGRG